MAVSVRFRRSRAHPAGRERHRAGREEGVLDHRGQEKPARFPERIAAATGIRRRNAPGRVQGRRRRRLGGLAGQGRVSEVCVEGRHGDAQLPQSPLETAGQRA